MFPVIRTTVITAFLIGSGTHALAQTESSTTSRPPIESPAEPDDELIVPEAADVLEGRSADDAEVVPAPAVAQPDKLRLEAGEFFLLPQIQVRPRLFAHSGKDFSAGGNQAYVTNRARLGMTLGHSNGIELTVRIQDTRIWGEETNSTDFVADGVDFHEGFGKVPLFGLGSLKVGRQEFNLDNQRLVGALDWAQRARAFDGLFLNLGLEMLQFDVFAAKVREADQDLDGSVPDGRSGDVDFIGFHPTIELWGQKLALVYLFNGAYEARSTKHTFGGTAYGLVAERLSYQFELYFQTGQSAGNDVSGLLVAGNLGYQMIGLTGKPKLSLWGEYISGDFDTLYATNHKFYGEMDFFINLPVQTLGLGLVDLGGRAELFPAKDLRFNVDFHHFRSAGEQDALGNDSFGSEFDIKITYKIYKFVGTRLLYGLFLPGELMRTRYQIDPANDLEVEHLVYWTLDFQI